MSEPPRDTAEAKARQRFIIMSAIRVFGIAQLLVGIALTRIEPYEPVIWGMGVALAVIGMLEFFFLPAIMAKRWKAGDRNKP